MRVLTIIEEILAVTNGLRKVSTIAENEHSKTIETYMFDNNFFPISWTCSLMKNDMKNPMVNTTMFCNDSHGNPVVGIVRTDEIDQMPIFTANYRYDDDKLKHARMRWYPTSTISERGEYADEWFTYNKDKLAAMHLFDSDGNLKCYVEIASYHPYGNIKDIAICNYQDNINHDDYIANIQWCDDGTISSISITYVNSEKENLELDFKRVKAIGSRKYFETKCNIDDFDCTICYGIA